MSAIVYRNVHDIEVWKSKLLEHVVDAFASQNQGDIQKSISTWRWSEELPFPTIDSIRINGGCLTFEVDVAGEPVFFSLWYTFGEVRVGVRIPHTLLEQSVGRTPEKISRAYDGQECQKITILSNGKFFDWIFRDKEDGFASFSTGIKATQCEATMIAIASKLADVLIHIYMATMNILIENGGLKVTIKQVKKKVGVKYMSFDVRGDKDAFEFWVKRFGTIDKKEPMIDGLTRYRVYGDALTVNSVSIGDHVIDDCWFSVLDKKEVSQ